VLLLKGEVVEVERGGSGGGDKYGEGGGSRLICLLAKSDRPR